MTEAQITADEFEAKYAAHSGMTVAELRESGRIVVACDCDYAGCEGWQSMSGQLLVEELGLERRPSQAAVMAATAKAVRTSMDLEKTMRGISVAVNG